MEPFSVDCYLKSSGTISQSRGESSRDYRQAHGASPGGYQCQYRLDGDDGNRMKGTSDDSVPRLPWNPI
jgi:hypothetical protein